MVRTTWWASPGPCNRSPTPTARQVEALGSGVYGKDYIQGRLFIALLTVQPHEPPAATETANMRFDLRFRNHSTTGRHGSASGSVSARCSSADVIGSVVGSGFLQQ